MWSSVKTGRSVCDFAGSNRGSRLIDTSDKRIIMHEIDCCISAFIGIYIKIYGSAAERNSCSKVDSRLDLHSLSTMPEHNELHEG